MSITIKRIAELAGVSVGTVDRVLNKRGQVKPQVEERIKNIISEVGYTPNLSAKSLALKRRSTKIGVIFHVKASSFVKEIMTGITHAQSELNDFGIQIIIRSSGNFNEHEQLKLIEELIYLGVSAIAITPINEQCIADKIDDLILSGFPVFCFAIDIKCKEKHPFIGPNAYEMGCIAAGLFHMISGENPHTLGVISLSTKMFGHMQKIQGLYDTLKTNSPFIKLTDICEIHDMSDVSIYKTVSAYLDAHPDITMLLYAFSISESGITALDEHSLLHKIKIITLDRQNFIAKGLEERYVAATISQNPSRQGYRMIKAIFNCLLNETYSSALSEYVPCEILIKENYSHPNSIF